MRGQHAAFDDHGERAAAEHACRARRRTLRRRRASMPSGSHTTSTVRRRADRNGPRAGSASSALDRVRLGLHLLETDARRAPAVSNRDVAVRAPTAGSTATPRPSASARDQVVGGAHARVPGAGGRESRHRSAAPAASSFEVADRRIPNGPGGREDHQRGQQRPQQREPPRRARAACSSFGADVEQEPRRRKVDAARLRRNEPQQPPQHRQAEQAEQNQRLREGEREAQACAASARPNRAAASRSGSGSGRRHAGTCGQVLAGSPTPTPPKITWRRDHVARVGPEGNNYVMPTSAGRRRAAARPCGRAAPASVRWPAVGAVDREAPAELVGLGANIGAMLATFMAS